MFMGSGCRGAISIGSEGKGVCWLDAVPLVALWSRRAAAASNAGKGKKKKKEEKKEQNIESPALHGSIAAECGDQGDKKSLVLVGLTAISAVWQGISP